MELRHLRYFIAVAEEQSFTKAAKRLYIEQGPLSKQIQKLEKDLNVRLFNRKNIPIQLTAAGQAFLEESRAILEQLEQAVRKAQRIHQGELGYLTVGFTSSIANSIFPDILRTFRQQYPEIEPILQEEQSSLLIQKLCDSQIDLIFLYLYHELSEADDLETISIASEQLVAVLPKNHPLAAQSQISLTDLKDEEFVMPLHQVGADLYEQIYHLCQQAGFVPKIAQTAVYMVTILGLVAGETGISLLPSNVQNIQREGVVYRPIQEQTKIAQLTAVWRRDNSSTILQRFIDIIQEM
ncbi:MAG: LysR family transcriptional regulator [Oscillatoriales cyanobacterium RU_3_3]|nr:LysR family transcriptional regulator [Microcoleus sp. SU_5_6]NJL66420.1 LysR family transcriptional regulator [Microcoleus sp. SM1_3_4]NJM59501.1 LysR family transcriptional regulator [Oscillatoriales cyanobacterium RU_3_3]NJR23163.1 LysR family transcriptional regulator [Richelia sp. CSU_2_1]